MGKAQILFIISSFLVIVRSQSEPDALIKIVNTTSSHSDNAHSHSFSSHSNVNSLEDESTRQGKFLISSTNAASKTNFQDKNDIGEEFSEDPSVAFNGIYSDCLLQLSFPCFQRKLLVFFDRLGRMKAFSLLGNFLSIVRLKRDLSPVIQEDDLKARLNPNEAQTALSSLMEHTLDKFIENHVLRITLPFGMTAAMVDESTAEKRSSGNSIDIHLSRALGEGRGKKKMKKMMGTMMMMMMGKMALMGPMMMMMIKIKAIKALILSKIALALSLMQLFKNMGKGKGGGGGGSSGKEVIIVHDNHGDGGGHGGGGGYGGSGGGWASGGGGGWASGGGGWASGGGGHGGGGGDSYGGGIHAGGGDANYAGSDSGHGGGGWAGGAGGGGHGGWGRRSAWDGPPQWMLTYKNSYNNPNNHNTQHDNEHAN